MSRNWDSWASQAGIAGADWRDPAAQDHVARYKMLQYFQTYGNWDLVAIAWFGGPGRANQARDRGINSVGALTDVLGTRIDTYVQIMRSNFGEGGDPSQVGRGLSPFEQISALPFGGETLTSPADTPTAPGDRLAELFSNTSNLVAGGARQPLQGLATSDIPAVARAGELDIGSTEVVEEEPTVEVVGGQ